jgi:hypothetical protein
MNEFVLVIPYFSGFLATYLFGLTVLPDWGTTRVVVGVISGRRFTTKQICLSVILAILTVIEVYLHRHLMAYITVILQASKPEMLRRAKIGEILGILMVSFQLYYRAWRNRSSNSD